MRNLVLPALRADDTLGFLAALGVLELCHSALAVPVTLAWQGTAGSALLGVPYADLDGLAAALVGTARALQESGRLTPARDAGLIRPPLGAKERKGLEERGALDPMRMSAEVALETFQALQDAELAGGPDAHWLCALVNQLAPAKRGASERRLTPAYSPSGQMTLHQLYRDALGDVLRRPQVIREALEGWRRAPGSGANLDNRALVDAAQASGGVPSNRAVPGATWLALQAVPWFQQVGTGSLGETTSWRHPRGGAVLRWPVWTHPLDPMAVRVLLSHAVVRDDEPSRTSTALGVVAVAEAGRRALSKSAGPLQAPRTVWSR